MTGSILSRVSSTPAAGRVLAFSTSCMYVGAVQQVASQMVWGNAIIDELDYSGSTVFARKKAPGR